MKKIQQTLRVPETKTLQQEGAAMQEGRALEQLAKEQNCLLASCNAEKTKSYTQGEIKIK